MSIGHAFAVANNAAKKGCSTGDLNWSGKQSVNPKSRSEMCAAVATWEAMQKANAAQDVGKSLGLIHKRRNTPLTDEVLCKALECDFSVQYDFAEDVAKKEYTSDEREEAASKNHAMPNGSYPIEDCEDVKDAWGLRGNSGTYSKSEIAAFVKRRAKELGCSVPGDDEEETSKSLDITISKTDDEQQIVFGWASVGIKNNGEVFTDSQGDLIDDPEEIAKSAYDFVLHSRDGGEEHVRKGVSTLVESFATTPEKLRYMGIPSGILPEAGWWTGFKVHDPEVWDGVKRESTQGSPSTDRGRGRVWTRTMAKGTTKKHRLSSMRYDEVSLVGKGANDEARILISKRDDEDEEQECSCQHEGKDVSKACRRCGGGKRTNAERAANWKEKRHARNPDGTFKRTSPKSKKKYGKGGTTGSLEDCAGCSKSIAKRCCQEGKETMAPKLKVQKNRSHGPDDENAESDDENTENTSGNNDDNTEDEDENQMSKSAVARDALGVALTAIEKMAGDTDSYETVMNKLNFDMDQAHQRWENGTTKVTKNNKTESIHQRVGKLVGEREAPVAKSENTEEDIFKGLTPEAAEIVRKSQEVMENNEQREWSELAKSYDYIPGDKDQLAKSLRTLHAADPEQYETVKQTLDASNYNLSQSDVFKSYGRAGASSGGTGDDAEAQAKELVAKSNGDLTHEQALVKIYNENPEKYYKSGS